jgi:mobilome CxxCx(11)CxxC protein
MEVRGSLMQDDARKTLRARCWNQRVECFGTAWIFERRAALLRKELLALSYASLILPVLVGGIGLTYGAAAIPTWLIFGAGAVGLVLLVISAAATVYSWVDALMYATEATTSHLRLSRAYENLAHWPPDDLRDFQHRVELLDAEYQTREDQDARRDVSPAEQRAGMRWALRQFQKECSGCDSAPIDMTPGDCPVCGRYRKRCGRVFDLGKKEEELAVARWAAITPNIEKEKAP